MSRETKPKSLPACQHIQLGEQLQAIRDQLFAVSDTINGAYSKSTKAPAATKRAIDGVDRLRSVLDDISWAELPGDRWSTHIYYRAGERTAEEVERVMAEHRRNEPDCCADAPTHPEEGR
jgi:hypothetical protein